MGTIKPIMIECHGISPWHYFLESMSWGFSRAQNDEDKMAFLNVDSSLKNGGRGLEDVLMADFLQSLSFAGDEFVNKILEVADMSLSLQSCEIKGNAGNYYIPYEDIKNGVRLAQPDGWIADENTLILLEAKGYRKSASLNNGQLAKEYLIAQSVAEKTGRGDNFYILLLVNKTEKIYEGGNEKKYYNLTDDDFKDLWKANVADLEKSYGKLLGDQLSNLSLKTKENWTEIRKHFHWIIWEEIKNLSSDRFKDNLCAEQISKTIKFHSSKNTTEKDWPIFSRFLAELAEKKAPLYLFYNGGCGDETLKTFETQYWKAIGHTETEPTPWQAWHDLKKDNRESLMKDLAGLEEARRKALSDLKDVEKKIKNFYSSVLNVSPHSTTRNAFELLGESAHIQPSIKYFEQRTIIDCKTLVNRFIRDRLNGDINLLKKYCFAELKGDNLYGDCVTNSFDCDNTRLARAIYVLLWGGEGNIFPKLTMENVGTGKEFRGDTMNSFNTVLDIKDKNVSQDIKDWVEKNAAYSKHKESLPGIISYWDKQRMGEKVKDFYQAYHTIGNFVVLPNLSAEKTTMGPYRGTTSGWHDFFDRFLKELDKVLSGSDAKDAKLYALVQCNHAFDGKTLPELADKLFLSDYMDGENPKELFAPYSTEKFRKDIDNEEYRAFAMRYIGTATEIIIHRAEIMCDRLKALLKEA